MTIRLAAGGLAGLLAVSSLAGGAAAALAPEYDRSRQFAAVANAGEVASALARHGLIDRIEWSEDLTYKVWARNCFVVVTLSPVAPKNGMVGPTDYEPAPGAVVCE